MTNKDIKKMKNQFSIFFDEPRSKYDRSNSSIKQWC